MANKITGQRRLDLSTPLTADAVGEWLAGLDDLDLERSKIEISLQFSTGHVGDASLAREVSNGLRGPSLGGLELVATWED